MEKLKILILSDYAFVKGGAERVAISSAAGLSEKGNEVIFFSAVGPVSQELKESKITKIICLFQDDILDNKNKFQSAIFGIKNKKAVTALKDLLKLWVPDIVHMHGVSKALSWAPVNLFYSLKIPVVYTLHDYGLLCPNLGIYDYRKEKACNYYKKGYGLKCLFTNCDKRSYQQKLWRWSRYFITRNFFKVLKKVSGFIAVSSFIKGIFIENHFLDEEKLTVIHNPITNSGNLSFGIDGRAGNAGKTRFLYVGRLSLEKGVDLLIDAIKDLRAELAIIGDGELFKSCIKASEESTDTKISVLGYKQHDEVFMEMLKSDAIVLPSRCMEPSPLVIGEAAFRRLPAIVADIGGLKEQVEDGFTGKYFKAGDVNSLREKLVEFIEDPALAKKLGNNAYKKVSGSDYNPDAHISTLLEYYSLTLEKSK